MTLVLARFFCRTDLARLCRAGGISLLLAASFGANPVLAQVGVGPAAAPASSPAPAGQPRRSGRRWCRVPAATPR